ncbi:MAG: VPLPA-CTERM sorting domain-containing protein, partial [Hyphomicrobium sp.]
GSSPAGSDLLVGSSPNKFIFLTDTTGLVSEDETSGGTTNLTSLIIGPGTYYLRLFGTIAGVSDNSVLTSLNGTITATPIPAGLPLFVTALGALGFMARRRRTAVPTAAV